METSRINWREQLTLLLTMLTINYQRKGDRSLPQIVGKTLDAYDYVIVGAGSAGSTLAYRLSEERNVSVLVLEAGGQPNVITEIPMANSFLYHTNQDWNYSTVEQKDSCQNLEGKASYWPRGKVLGGSSSINFMIYIRGNRRDYDHWESLGATGWGWKNVFPYFLKAEDNQNLNDPNIAAPGYHGKGGPLSVEKPGFESGAADAFLEAGRQLGYGVHDCNGPEQKGFCRLQGTLKNGLRCSTARAYLLPASRRSNVHVRVRAMVTRVLFRGRRAVGVEFRANGRLHKVMARREVILSGGAINSPTILMRSGIGPKDHLQKLKIPVVQASEQVGSNLQDHISAHGLMFFVNTSNLVISARDIYDFPTTVDKLLRNSSGLLTLLGGVEAGAFVSTKGANSGDEWPDIQFHFIPASINTLDYELRPLFSVTKTAWDAFYGEEKRDSFLILPVLLRPKSRGKIRLRSNNPLEEPMIDPRYLEEQEDVHTLVGGMKVALEVARTPVMARLGARPPDRHVMGCEGHELWSDAYLACHARAMTMTFYHPSGTCRMGSDPESVVDPQLRVRGVQGLRVVDASVMPTVVSGNTNAPVIMMAERMADIIKGKIT